MSHSSQMVPQSRCLPLHVIYLGRWCFEIMLRILIMDILCTLCKIGKKVDSCFPRLLFNPCSFPHLGWYSQDFDSFFHIITISFTAGVKGRRHPRAPDTYQRPYRKPLGLLQALVLKQWSKGFFLEKPPYLESKMKKWMCRLKRKRRKMRQRSK